MSKYKESPCVGCRRTADPEGCDNKDCKQWQRWYIARWDHLRQRFLRGQDPCESCPCPKELCLEDCQRRRQWLEERREKA